MNFVKQKSVGLLFVCIGVLLLHVTTSAIAGRPLVVLSKKPPLPTPSLDFTIDRGCPSKADVINLNISTARGTETSFAASTPGTGINTVDVYAALLRPDGHIFSLNSLSEPGVLTPIISSWDVVNADSILASYPMSQMPINEAGFYSLYIGFFEPQAATSTGRPVILIGRPPATPPIAVAVDKFYVNPNVPYIALEPGSWNLAPQCICNSGMWELLYHATTTMDVGVFKLSAVWDGTIQLTAPIPEEVKPTVVKARPLIALKDPVPGVPAPERKPDVTGSGTITLKESLAIPELGCLGTVDNAVQVTVEGYTTGDKFDLTIKTPAVSTFITATCPKPAGPVVMPFNIPAGSFNIMMPAVHGAELDLTDYVLLSSGRPLVPLAPAPTGPSIKLQGNYQARCNG